MPAKSKIPTKAELKSIDRARAAARSRFKHLGKEGGGLADAVDPENPPLSDQQLARMRPAHEVHPALVAASMLRRGGRPKSAERKTAISIRLDQDVVEALKAEGGGWQTLLNGQLFVVKSLAASGQDQDAGGRQDESDEEFIARMKATKGMPTASEVERFRRIERGRVQDFDTAHARQREGEAK